MIVTGDLTADNALSGMNLRALLNLLAQTHTPTGEAPIASGGIGFIPSYFFSYENPVNRALLYRAFKLAQQEILLANASSDRAEFIARLREDVETHGTRKAFNPLHGQIAASAGAVATRIQQQYGRTDLQSLRQRSRIMVMARHMFTSRRSETKLISLEPLRNAAKLTKWEVEATLFYLDQLNQEKVNKCNALPVYTGNAPVIKAARSKLTAG